MKFDEVTEVFEYMKNNEIKIDEKALTLHLLNLKRYDQMELANGFFRLMVGSGLDVVTVYSLTVVVSSLCCNGEIKRARELVEEVKIKPNIVTFKSMIDCCVKRWDFEELDLVLKLMEKESVTLDLDTFKILIEGFTGYGKVEEAERLVSTMHNKKDTYWALMNGLCNGGKVCEAMRLLDELRVNGFEVDEAMYTMLIQGCFRGAMVDESLAMVAEMIRKGLMPDVTILEGIAHALFEVNRVEALMMVTFLVKSGVKPKYSSDLVPKEVY
ncbi:unnamed protein product [Microthlaspi erraticum]|uniref:Pentacotripeptide-repeat region of PRORP domain-containing protein n=1 Tax=Microthlaspi erraticum TaxID=1685480 RepID=A0A6D2KLD9_9BRAS|nr:unnamed protein product [Microthlaspi erraticum]